MRQLGPERWNHLPKVVQTSSGQASIWTKFSCQICCLNSWPTFFLSLDTFWRVTLVLTLMASALGIYAISGQSACTQYLDSPLDWHRPRVLVINHVCVEALTDLPNVGTFPIRGLSQRLLVWLWGGVWWRPGLGVERVEQNPSDPLETDSHSTETI